MMAGALTSLEHLVATDPTVAPLARLYVLALNEADDPSWANGVPELGSVRWDGATPLLQDVTLRVDVDRARRLLRQLAAILDQAGSTTSRRLGSAFASADIDPLELLRASATQRTADLEAVASRADIEAPVLAVVANAATLPLLIACGRRAADAVHGSAWSRGYCPVCAAWPTLAEVRGLARELILRCGRCGSGWPFEHRRCAFCDSREERTQSYFAAEQERESRRAITCDRCHGYLKTQTTLGQQDIADVLLRDLESLELDVVVLEHGYSRPEGPGWSLSLRIEAMPGQGRGRLGRWWR
jgi:formate dehydrogenase maturation protein FdhE